MDKYVGKRLEGRYEIQELIGMGGMANVYKAYDVIDQRTVAVKILRDEYLDNMEFLRRFKNESKAIAVLSHPNIVRVYDVSFNNRIHSIVMEYIDGITLKDYIERQSVLTWKEAIHFTLQILRALQHAHDKGIVHRDIKPQNIMLLQNGAIKVTDFGIARFARSEVQTITDRAIGSVHYISPEQAMGDNTDEKSDIYSVGVMLFEMLTGRLPFEADTAVSVALKQIQTQAVRPRSINPEIPEGLEDITIRAMQKESSRRYQSAAEMIADIEAFKKDPSIHFQYKYLNSESEQAKKKKIGRAIKETRKEEPVPRKRRTPYIPILTGVTLAFVLASAGFIGLMVYFNNPFAQVAEDTLPDLVGLKLDTVVSRYSEKFYIELEEEVPSDDYAVGVIIEQRPRANTLVRLNSTVMVKVSKGQEIVPIPDFENKNVSQVVAKLRDMGLEPREERIYSDTIPAQSVVYTDPSKNSEVSTGSQVTVYVSLGPDIKYEAVPSLEGLDLDGAKRLLELHGFRLGEATSEISDMPDGTIISQTPAAGSLQPQEATINVVVSEEGMTRIALPITLPNLNREIFVRARVGEDQDIAYQEFLNPSEIDGNMIRPQFSGNENELLFVRIYVDARVYQEYWLDFSTGNYTLERDRSNEAEFRE